MNECFKIDCAAMADLSNDLRGRVIDAITEAAAAVTSGDEDRQRACIKVVRQLSGEVREFRHAQSTRKVFGAASARGTGDVMTALAKRAGVLSQETFQ